MEITASHNYAKVKKKNPKKPINDINWPGTITKVLCSLYLNASAFKHLENQILSLHVQLFLNLLSAFSGITLVPKWKLTQLSEVILYFYGREIFFISTKLNYD